MTDVASLGVWPLGDLPGVCVRRALPLLGPVALGPRVLTSRLPHIYMCTLDTAVLAAFERADYATSRLPRRQVWFAFTSALTPPVTGSS